MANLKLERLPFLFFVALFLVLPAAFAAAFLHIVFEDSTIPIIVFIVAAFLIVCYLDYKSGYYLRLRWLALLSLVGLFVLGWLFLSVITCCALPSPSSKDPRTAFSNALADVYSKGYGFSAVQKIEFPSGYVLRLQDVVADATNRASSNAAEGSPLRLEDVYVSCGNCGTLYVSQETIIAEENAAVYVVAFGDSARETFPKYCIALDVSSAEVSVETASLACGIK